MGAPKRGVAGDVDYELAGVGYAHHRQPDPRIAARFHAALGAARTVLNVGAGAGSYEPTDREVTAVEPAAAMRAQRPAHLTAAIDAVAADLPFADAVFDAAMASVTVHQWPDVRQGLRELRRVTRGPVAILTFDPDAIEHFWLADYVPELLASERNRFPAVDTIRAGLGGDTRVEQVPVPAGCTDGFIEAFYGRPEAFLDPKVRRAQSAWSFVDEAVTTRSMAQLRHSIESGQWDRAHAALRTEPHYRGSLCLVVGER